ncbi:MAG: type II secretion system minor pseudopilin GspK [Roseovarius sp.]
MVSRLPRFRRLSPRGVALLNALLIVAALSAVSLALLQRSEASNARLVEMQRAGQAELYLDAVTLQVQQVIGPAARGTDGETLIVEPSQSWARPAQGILIGEGVASWQVADMQGRFNLAWLGQRLEALPGEDEEETEEPPDLNRMLRDAFSRLVLERGLSRVELRRLEQALIPDLGQRVSAYGRATRPPPLPPAALDELLLVEGIGEEALAALRPILTTMPADAGGLNLNTVSAEVLAALMGERSAEALEAQLASARPFDTVEAALDWVSARGGPEALALVEALGAGVGSQWFEARMDVRLDTLRLRRRVVMQRANPESCCRILSVLSEYP